MDAAANPLRLVNPATDPLPVNTLKKVLPIGLASGLALGLLPAGLLEWLRRRRERKTTGKGDLDSGNDADRSSLDEPTRSTSRLRQAAHASRFRVRRSQHDTVAPEA
jgi:hypothetical protein